MHIQRDLSPRQKAAVIIRLLLDDESGANLDKLDNDNQALLAEEMATMSMIDRHTRDSIISEFCDSLEEIGVTFPGSLDGTLEILGSKLSEDTADRLSRLSVMMGRTDPWPRINALPIEHKLILAENEAPELVAVMLSKLPPTQASQIFSKVPREKARAIAQTMALVGDLDKKAAMRIGQALVQAVESIPQPSGDGKLTDHMGEILNFASAELRDDVIGALADEDEVFAEAVRRAVFIFAHIPDRIAGKDIVRICREVEQQVLVRALAAKSEEDAAAAEFVLANLSQRMAGGIKEEIEGLTNLRQKEIEEAGAEVVAAIRRLETQGEITLLRPDDEE